MALGLEIFFRKNKQGGRLFGIEECARIALLTKSVTAFIFIIKTFFL